MFQSSYFQNLCIMNIQIYLSPPFLPCSLHSPKNGSNENSVLFRYCTFSGVYYFHYQQCYYIVLYPLLDVLISLSLSLQQLGTAKGSILYFYKKKSEVEKNRKISCVGKRIQEKVVIEAFLGEKKIKNSCFTSLPVKSKGNPVWRQHYLFVFFCGSLSNATF